MIAQLFALGYQVSREAKYGPNLSVCSVPLWFMLRNVHLSLDVARATKVGQRHGKPVILTVRAGDMRKAGHVFFVSANGVWLTERVPIEFIDEDHGNI